MWTDEIKTELTEHIIPFWLSMKDEENGGFYGYLSYDLELNKKADKGCILNSRILWFFSHAYQYLGDEKLKDAATHAYRFLKQAMLDVANGGVYWSVTYDGLPADTQKHTYNQAFAVYGLAAYYEISRDKAALDLAYALMNVIEEKCSDEGGYLEAFTIDFKPRSNEELSENGVEATRTMNTLLHVFEAYTELYRVDRQEKVRDKMIEILHRFTKYFYNTEKKRQEVFFDKDYNSLIDLHSYGHDIETSWLVKKGVDLLDDPEISAELDPILLSLSERVYETAFDGTALLNECENGVNDTKRIWWVECEAIIGFLNRAQLEEDAAETDKYLNAAMTVWAFVRDHLVDKREGSEWLSEVDTDNVPFSKKPIVEEWKCPYHNGRMCLEVLTAEF